MSESEEMYLVSIARLNESDLAGPVPLSQLATELDVAPVSANQMIRKLEEGGLVAYTPYKGVSLTSEGRRLALRILRHRRLWEVFLVEHLQYAPADAETLACRMEHAIPEEAAARLAAFLGNPTVSPQGRPIPEPGPGSLIPTDISLSQLKPAEGCQVAQVTADAATRAFLASEGVLPGARATVLAIGGHGSMLLGTEQGRSVHLSEDLVSSIWVKAIEPEEYGSGIS